MSASAPSDETTTASAAAASPPQLLPLRIITLNIRYATSRLGHGERPWPERCPRICAQLRHLTSAAAAGPLVLAAGAGAEGEEQNGGGGGGASAPSGAFVCLQEALHFQLEDVLAGLNGGGGGGGAGRWAYIGGGRNDGAKTGEASPILYQPAVWRVERAATYWLAEDPHAVGTLGWDAVIPRVVTMGYFVARTKAAAAGKEGGGVGVIVMSTHLDHRGVRAREEAAKLLARLAKQWVDALPGDPTSSSPPPPVFLGGDFNSTPQELAYRNMTAGMVDLWDLAAPGARHGNELTFTSFAPGRKGSEPSKRIDFLFAREPEAAGVKVLGVAVEPNCFDDGVFLSDHRAVVADVAVPIRGV